MIKFSLSRKLLVVTLMCASFWGGIHASAETGITESQAVNQSKQVTGRVTDAANEPLIGVSVTTGAGTGTVTDLDGNYVLPNVTSNTMVTFSYVGYASQTVKVGQQSTINIQLIEDNALLEEVVVVGYGSMRKKDLTGSVVQIDPNKIADQNPNSVQDILRGTPGLQIGFEIKQNMY